MFIDATSSAGYLAPSMLFEFTAGAADAVGASSPVTGIVDEHGARSYLGGTVTDLSVKGGTIVELS